MTLSLSNLKGNFKAKSRKRVGRGNASGHGTYSTRGLKGQKSRSGVSGLKRLGMKKQLLAIPKKRGFRSYQTKNETVDFDDLNLSFKDGALVNPKTLLRAGLIQHHGRVKILSRGELKVKNLHFKDVSVSKAAEEKLKASGAVLVTK